MALQTAQPRSPTPPALETRSTTLLLWLRRVGSGLGRPLLALALALIAGLIVIMITASGSLFDRFNAALLAYGYLFSGAFGNAANLSFSLVNVTPLIFTGLSVAIAYRARLFNIGAEGQFAAGAILAAFVGMKCSTWPGWLLTPLMIVAGSLAGALWGGIVGLLKAWRGAHEVVTTIMLNWIIFYVSDWLVSGPLQAPGQADQTPSMPPQTNLPKLSVLYNQTLGHFLPTISQPEQYVVDVGFLFALVALVAYWFLMSRTTFGYETRVVGENPRAAQYAGISVKRNVVLVMALAGLFAGLGGTLQLMGQYPYEVVGQVFRNDTTGFDAIGVALLGRMTAIGIFLGALLFGGMRQGGSLMQLKANVPGDLVYIIEALVLFSIAVRFLPVIRQALVKRFSAARQPTVVAALAGGVVDLDQAPANGAEAPTMNDQPLSESGRAALADDGSGQAQTPAQERQHQQNGEA
ncbi:ABC transporter permease [Thermogemmatispora carboxidivorans]|uniref:ABC transporter permease n=1 Tax=Thermogemmatispora carboxidivorans TaxID=1382306 RepID=UPI00069A8FD1|nr:ABC transporter permease [Thermogemmatispora carboxidivorans]